MTSQIMLTSSNKCKICETERSIKKYKGEKKYTLWKCSHCKVIYIDSKYENIDQKFISDTLSDDSKVEYWSIPRFFTKYDNLFQHYFTERLKKINRYISGKKILDIGCGYGLWLRFLEREQFDVCGIDLSYDAISYCRNNSINAIHTTFENFTSREKYSAITCCDVLEHVTDPLSFLQQCKGLLNENGLLYLQVPDVYGFRFPLRHDPLLPHHRWHFKYKSLRVLLNKAGFEVLEHTTGILGVIGEIEKKGRETMWMKLKWGIISKLKLGNRLQVIARVNLDGKL